MEIKDLFNVSSEMLAQMSAATEGIVAHATAEHPVAYGCICCGSGICCAGIADD